MTASGGNAVLRIGGGVAFATSLLNDVPVAIPLTPPSRFSRAVANIKHRVTLSGTSPRAKSAASNNNDKISASSKQTRNISLVHPPGPGATPDGEPCRHEWKNFRSSVTARGGWASNTAGGISRNCVWGRLNSPKVAPFFGANAAAHGTPGLAGCGSAPPNLGASVLLLQCARTDCNWKE